MILRLSCPGKLFQAFSISLVALVVGCAQPHVSTAPVGTMDVLGPVPAFEPNALPLDWVRVGNIAQGQLSVVTRDGVPAQKVINGKQSFIAVKPTQASLLATPYLSWAWNMAAHDKDVHPVRLAIGFLGGNPQSQSQAGSQDIDRAGLPPHDRAVVIVWGLSALQRGAISIPKTTVGRQAAAQYTPRGGSENTDSWWFETVDLSDIYRRAWPGDDAGKAKITFIGIAAAPARKPTAAYISGLRLSR
ncbi:MAG: hypothetical protein O3A85_00325 [Proteobacteria bacterium]|nr:hypothetical protein [Pseudomonadota bacterium]